MDQISFENFKMPDPPGGIPGPAEHFPQTQVCPAGHPDCMLHGVPKKTDKK